MGGRRWWPSRLYLGPQSSKRSPGHGTNVVIFKKRIAGLSSAALAQFIGRASRATGLKGEVNVLVTGSQELRALNAAFCGKDKATDVLSFPSGSMDGFAGDIAISAQIAVENAKGMGHSAGEEIKILALHGLLHLAGYDHEADGGEMERKELRLRRDLGLPVGLIERNRPRRARPPSPHDSSRQGRRAGRRPVPTQRRSKQALRTSR